MQDSLANKSQFWNICLRVGGGIFNFLYQQQFFIHIRDRVSIKMPFVAGWGGSVNNQQKSVCGENTKYIWQNGTKYIW